jgi:hypothetical protein
MSQALQFPPNAYKPKVEFEAFPDEDDDLDTDSKEKVRPLGLLLVFYLLLLCACLFQPPLVDDDH